MHNLFETSGHGSLEAWFPRGLVRNGSDVLSAHVTAEGLCPLRICWKMGRVTKIEAVKDFHSLPLKLLLPRLVEPHAHIDKAFTWEEFPNLRGTYKGALHANLREHELRTPQLVRFRAEKALEMSLKNGLRSLRTHVDSFGSTGNQSWEVLDDLKLEWKNIIELQCVALVPLEYWSSSEGYSLATIVAKQHGLLGGVLTPPFDQKKSYKDLLYLLKLANKLGCGIDLHIDEATDSPALGLRQLIRILDEIECQVPITCSHLSSMSLLSSEKLKYFAEKLAKHNIGVVALPLTNGWLLGRQERETPLKRALAPIMQLHQAGVTVAIGGDNVRDPWFPFGNLDPISLMSASMPLTQLAPWQRLGLSSYTSSAAALMKLEWDGTIGINSPADFFLLNTSSWSDVLSSQPSRQCIVNGNWLNEKNNSF